MARRLADVPAPFYFAHLVPALIVVAIFDRVFTRKKVLEAVLTDVAPASLELAQHFRERHVESDAYAAEMKALNQTMLLLSKRVYYLTIVAVFAGVVAAGSAVIAIVV